MRHIFIALYALSFLSVSATAQLILGFNSGNYVTTTDLSGEPLEAGTSGADPAASSNYLQSMTLTDVANLTPENIVFTVYCVCLEPTFSATPIFSTTIPVGLVATGFSFPLSCSNGCFIAWTADNPVSTGVPEKVVFF